MYMLCIYVYIYIYTYIFIIYIYIYTYYIMCYSLSCGNDNHARNPRFQAIGKFCLFLGYYVYFFAKNYKSHRLQKPKTGKTHKTFHDLTCKSQDLSYLLQSRISFVQHFGKTKTTFYLRLSNNWKDCQKKYATLGYTTHHKPESYICTGC